MVNFKENSNTPSVPMERTNSVKIKFYKPVVPLGQKLKESRVRIWRSLISWFFVNSFLLCEPWRPLRFKKLESLFVLIPQHFQIQSFHSLPGPRSFSEKFQTGINRRIVGEASDVDPLTEVFPAIKAHQIGDNIGKCNSVKRIVELVFRGSFQFKM